MALKTLLALCVLLSCAMAQQQPECGDSGRQCIFGQSTCVGSKCVCDNPPFAWGDGFFACYPRNTVAAESRNDPSLTTFNNETFEFPYPCRYLLSHVKQELKGRQRVVIGYCDIKVHAFNRRDRGKVFTHGVDIAVKLVYKNESIVERSVRKFGTAASGVNDFTVNGVQDFLPNGPFTPSEDILYKDAPNKVEIKCSESAENNQLVFEIKACGLRITFVPYDVEDRTGQSQIPGLSMGVNCAHQPKWLSNDKVLGLAPVFQDGQLVAEIVRPGLSEAESLVDRAFVGNFVQNQPDASPACPAASTAVSACSDKSRKIAYEKCFWMLDTPKFVKCVHKNGLDSVDLFARCVASFCQYTEDCPGVASDISVCGHIASQIPDLAKFISGASCPEL